MRGIIYIPDRVKALDMRKLFENKGFTIIVTQLFEVLVNNLWDFAPDFIVIHCHVFGTTEINGVQIKDRFEEVQKLISLIREKLRNTLVVLSYSDLVDEKYFTMYVKDKDCDYYFPEEVDIDKIGAIEKMVIAIRSKI